MTRPRGAFCGGGCSFRRPARLWGPNEPHLPVSPPTADIISTVEFNHTGELLATGDKGGRVVIFQREPEVRPDLVVAGGGLHPAQALAHPALGPREALRVGGGAAALA